MGATTLQCVKCQHEQQGGKFCVKCGSRFEMEIGGEPGAAAVPAETVPYTSQSQQASYQPVQPQPSSQHVETAKNVSKMYVNFFLKGLKNPTNSSQAVFGDQFVNGLITMVLYAISIPLMIYFALKGLPMLGGMVEFSFSDVVVKPAFYYLLFIAVIAITCFAAIRLGKSVVTFKDVFARFGSFLVVPTGFLIVALILSLLGVELSFLFLAFGFLGLFLVVPFTIYSFKKDVPSGLDGVYGTFLTYLVIILLIVLIGDVLLGQLEEAMSSFIPF